MEHSASMVSVPYVVEVVAFLITVVFIVPVFKKINISPILGYLVVGALIGPYSLGIVSDVEGVQHVAELGVIFLLFTIGLELSFERLRSFSRLIFGLGTAQVMVSALVIGLLAYLWGNDLEAAIIIGLCLALSSTAMTMQILGERGEIATPHGRVAFAVLLFQDLAVVPILILVTLFGGETEGGVLASVAMSLLKAIAAVAAIVVFGRFVLRYLFRTVAATRSVDVFTAMILLAILATSLVTGMAGLSMALGAFLAGLLLAETEFRHQIESEIEPFKGLLLGLFFMSVGMSLDFAVAFARGLWVILSVVGLIVLKAVITAVCARLFGVRWDVALRSGILLAEAGEFAFVVIGKASLVYGLISPDVAQFMVMVAGLSMTLTPALAILGKWMSSRFWPEDQNADPASLKHEDISGHVIIAGFGRVGRAVAAVLKGEAIPYVALDTNAADVKRWRERNEPVFVGDAIKPELLKHAGIDRAAAVLVTMDNAQAARSTLDVVRKLWPHLPVVVRSRDARHAQELVNAGATQVVPETLEASLQLSGHLLCTLGYPREDANACLEVIRRHDYREIKSNP